MLWITANLSVGQVRRAQLHGRPHLVVPATLIVPGVLTGSKGALRYTPEDLSKSAPAWNGMPIVVYHPEDQNGQHISARNAEILDRQGVGTVFNAQMNGKLVSEAWLDEARLRQVDLRVLDALEAGEPMELSTGLFTDEVAAAAGAELDGKPYTHIARNHRPDHLAILPDRKGACSLADGCGLLVNDKDTKRSDNTNKEGDLGMTKLNEKQRKTLVDFVIANCAFCDEDDREALGKLTDEKLLAQEADIKKAQNTELVANAARKGFTDPGGNDHTWNEEKQEWETKAKKDPAPTANQEGTAGDGTTENKDDKDKQPKTMDEWMQDDMVPAEVRSAVANAAAIEQREKSELANRLIANIKDDKQKAAQHDRLMKRSLVDLQADVQLLPAQKDQSPTAHYAGQAGGGAPKSDDFDEDDVLALPTVNWEKEAEALRKAAG